MLFRNHKSHDTFKKWGREHHVLPPANERLKEMVLAVQPPHKEVSMKRPTRLLWIGSGILCSVLALMVVTNYVTNSLSPATGSGTVYETVPGESSATALSKNAANEVLHDNFSVRGEVGAQGPALAGRKPGIVQLYDRLTEPTIEDTREFLKTGYTAYIKTRNVSRIANRIQTMVRGHGGRIDNASVTKKSASISFVLPKASFEQFKTELKEIVPDRVLEESITIENRLQQKQGIEAEIRGAEDTISLLQSERQSLVTSHANRVAAIQKKIQGYNARISLLNAEGPTTTERQAQIDRERAQVNAQLRTEKQALVNENAQYQRMLNDIDIRMQHATQARDQWAAEENHLIQDVETVNGYISIQWVHFLAYVNLFVPIYWIMGGVAILLMLYLLFGRRVSINEDLLK
ncbi:MAG TPA: hypothetical protein VEA18_00485 [Candidatus Kapabacteria bacterium]|nr:hypothetical protein [Candidatus Kapabacteria bacterium]